MKKSDREIMEILEAFDLTRCAHSAADLAACDPKTVARYVGARDTGRDPHAPVRRPMLVGSVPRQDRGARRALRRQGPG